MNWISAPAELTSQNAKQRGITQGYDKKFHKFTPLCGVIAFGSEEKAARMDDDEKAEKLDENNY